MRVAEQSFYLFAGIAVTVSAWLSWRVRRSAAKARQWPPTEATIESAAIETVRQDEHGYNDFDLPTFGFSYRVAGEFYAGRFALRPPFKSDDDRSLLLRMVRRKFPIHYDPENPGMWILHDEMIEGCKVEEIELKPWLSRL